MTETELEAAEEKVSRAAEQLYLALGGRRGPVDFGADNPLVKAIAEYGQACREAGAALALSGRRTAGA